MPWVNRQTCLLFDAARFASIITLEKQSGDRKANTSVMQPRMARSE